MSNRKEFILIVLLIAVITIGILAAVVIPYIVSTQDRAKEDQSKEQQVIYTKPSKDLVGKVYFFNELREGKAPMLFTVTEFTPVEEQEFGDDQLSRSSLMKIQVLTAEYPYGGESCDLTVEFSLGEFSSDYTALATFFLPSEGKKEIEFFQGEDLSTLSEEDVALRNYLYSVAAASKYHWGAIFDGKFSLENVLIHFDFSEKERAEIEGVRKNALAWLQ